MASGVPSGIRSVAAGIYDLADGDDGGVRGIEDFLPASGLLMQSGPVPLDKLESRIYPVPGNSLACASGWYWREADDGSERGCRRSGGRNSGRNPRWDGTVEQLVPNCAGDAIGNL